jgi:NitT/TauT family transport system ATP-binding protein
MSEPLLSVREVVKTYGKGAKTFAAIRGINLDIKVGEFVCLLGPSGCGKSTLLRIITGLNTATDGTVLYRGEELEGVNPHATIVFQTFALYPWLTVEENVSIALKARGVPAAEREERAVKLIDTVGLAGFESAYPRELSGGMRQKVGFARAMAVEPELFCLDEPFSALDVLSAEGLRGELMELWLSKAIPTKAILMVTHNIEEAVLMADRIVVMAKDPGRIVTEIPVALHHPRQRKDPAFQALVDRVYAAVAGKTKTEAEMASHAQLVHRQRLPGARLNALAGFVEKIASDGGRTDIYRLGGELVLELDDLLPIVEAGELMGLLTVQEGDLFLTPLGQAYADASIVTRKELVAGRILRQPTIRWIYETLQSSEERRIDREPLLEVLHTEMGEQADDQLDIAVNWGRYAELFAYDDDTGELYLEES